MILPPLGFEGAGFLYLEGDVIKMLALCEIGLPQTSVYLAHHKRHDMLTNRADESRSFEITDEKLYYNRP